jgi:hypothetical protein
MKVIRSIGVVSMGKFQGALCAMGGLVFGLLYGGTLVLIGVDGAGSHVEGISRLGARSIGGGLAVMAFAPLVYGLLGFVAGLLEAVLINLALKFSGGLEVEME